ncbi:MAG: FecR domain-containing protein [Porticoccaceae bacterium]|jgi:transmembrane sensor
MSTQLDRAVLEAAAAWYVDLRDTGAEDPLREAHRQWLAQHPAHRQAWARVEKLQRTLDAAPRAITRSTLDSARATRRQAIKALSLVLVAGVAGAAWRYRGGVDELTADYRTAIGGSAQATLSDGSLLRLDTASAVDIRYGDQLREILLHSGEIHITTAPDAAGRPFIVHTRHGSIRALGTAFLVRSDDRQARLGVLRHAVEIRLAERPGQPTRLDAGQQVHFTRWRAETPQPLPAGADAWTRRLLVVSDWPLRQFLDELSRYHRGRLSCDDAVAGLRISGAFHLDDIHAVLGNLTATLPIRVRYLTRYWARVEAAGKSDI